jgi:hypothetical protein
MKPRSRGVARLYSVSVARLERFEFAAQNNCQSEITLPDLEQHLAAFHHAAFA